MYSRDDLKNRAVEDVYRIFAKTTSFYVRDLSVFCCPWIGLVVELILPKYYGVSDGQPPAFTADYFRGLVRSSK